MRRNLLATCMLCLALMPAQARAHCDTMDGPVVNAAQAALESGNANLVLIWVKEEGEAEIRALFEKVLRVRKLGSEAQELADMYFFETLVRVHRAGEGVPYTGVLPAGTKIPDAILAADEAVATGKIEPLERVFPKGIPPEAKEKFEVVVARAGYDGNDLKAGRAWVEAYVIFFHTVEELAGGEPEPHHHGGHQH